MEKEVRREGGIPDGLVVGLLALLLSVAVLVWTATGLAGLLAHGAWPDGVTFGRTPLALRSLLSAPTDLPAAWPGTPPGALSGHGLFWGLVIGEAMVLVVLAVFVLGTLARWRAVRAGRRAGTYAKGRGRRVPDDGYDGRAYEQTGPYDRAAQAQAQGEPVPGPAPRLPAQSGPHDSYGPHAPHDSYDSYDSYSPPAPHGPAVPPAPAAPPATTAPPAPTAPRIVYGPAATRRPLAVQAVRDAEGAVLVVTSDPALWAETKDARGKLGPVLVYDPGHLCDTPARLHWSPAEGCEDATVAQERATALLAPVRPQARLDAALADTAETLLRCWLHAAATDGRPFKQVHRWAQGADAHDPVRILRTHPKAAAGHAGLLESALTAHPERRRAAQELTARALSSLSSIHIREACTTNRTDSLTLASFVAEQGTLYVVGEPIEDPRTHPGAMPLLTALAASVVEHGRRMAARSSDGRLDPPLSLVLDDIAAVAPIPGLPDLVAEGADRGLPALALMRSPEQARSRWPEPLPHA
ncbi:type IV secretory system conjugative DNA transfer family protein [Streptomyces sp. NPDC012769]|uniref:type IV secretory system conjugative DNA transfer family protein n=1 Tax=Streptomyces sp. NPDC012769 TaxID=3364848 RepID=UPI00367E7A4A